MFSSEGFLFLLLPFLLSVFVFLLHTLHLLLSGCGLMNSYPVHDFALCLPHPVCVCKDLPQFNIHH